MKTNVVHQFGNNDRILSFFVITSKKKEEEAY
jgi:hypothetical protein